MTMLGRDSVRCGNCGAVSAQAVLWSTNAFGSPDLDLRPPEMQRSTMETWLQLCPGCGYCAPTLSDPPADPAEVGSAAYRAALQTADVPELARRFLAYSVLAGASNPADAARACLEAAWVCDDDGLVGPAARCRRESAAWFERCRPFPADETGAGTAAVLADVLRRAGEFGAAAAECRAALAAPGATGTLRKVLEFQLRLVAGGDAAAHLIAECG